MTNMTDGNNAIRQKQLELFSMSRSPMITACIHGKRRSLPQSWCVGVWVCMSRHSWKRRRMSMWVGTAQNWPHYTAHDFQEKVRVFSLTHSQTHILTHSFIYFTGSKKQIWRLKAGKSYSEKSSLRIGIAKQRHLGQNQAYVWYRFIPETKQGRGWRGPLCLSALFRGLSQPPFKSNQSCC